MAVRQAMPTHVCLLMRSRLMSALAVADGDVKGRN